MDPNFTSSLQSWLNTPKAERDYAQGALMLLQLTSNKIMYNRLSLNPTGKTNAEFIEGKLKQHLDFRLQQLTHQQVMEMQQQVDEIIKSHSEFKENNPADDFKKGKRADHDGLPDEIKACYIENADILKKMRELHLQLRKLSEAPTTCPDSDRYPFLKEIRTLDIQYHDNWYTYDHYVAGKEEAESTTTAETPTTEDTTSENTTSTTKKKSRKKKSAQSV